jgi:hypothetical protein
MNIVNRLNSTSEAIQMNSNKFFVPMIFLFFSACQLGKIDKSKAIELTTQLLSDLKQENYDRLDSYYMDSFNASEPSERKKEKFKRLREVMGPIQSIEMLEAIEEHDSVSGLMKLKIKYKVTCSKVTALQTFVIINDEGNLKIIFQNIENLKEG